MRRPSPAPARARSYPPSPSAPRPPSRQHSYSVQRHDPRMFEAGDRPCLGAQPFDGIRRCKLAGQHFDRDPAAQLGVFRFVDDPHPTAGQLSLQAVARVAEVRQLGDDAKMSDAIV